MRREALTLVGLMFVGTLQMAACDFKEDKTVVTAQPPTIVVPPAVGPAPRAELSTPTAAEQKEGASPAIQGQVDPKQDPQKRDFQQRTN